MKNPVILTLLFVPEEHLLRFYGTKDLHRRRTYSGGSLDEFILNIRKSEALRVLACNKRADRNSPSM